MFQKKDYIFSETMGVCQISDVTNLAPKNGESVSYYVLRSAFQKEKVAYIPVENHAVALRELISLEKAVQMAETYRKLTEEQIQDLSIEEKFLKDEAEFVIRAEELKKSKKRGC